jgi:acyl-CoA hydrolase
LHGKTIRERARSLINIAHPKFRETLEFQARELGYLPEVFTGISLKPT